MAHPIALLKSAVRFRDIKLLGQAVEALTKEGVPNRECYRIALAGDASLTPNDWEDLMARCEERLNFQTKLMEARPVTVKKTRRRAVTCQA